jgi:hypothetical protein
LNISQGSLYWEILPLPVGWKNMKKGREKEEKSKRKRKNGRKKGENGK